MQPMVVRRRIRSPGCSQGVAANRQRAHFVSKVRYRPARGLMAQLEGPTGETSGGVSKRWWLGMAAVAMVGAAVVAVPLSVHRATGPSASAAATPSGFIGYACGFT